MLNSYIAIKHTIYANVAKTCSGTQTLRNQPLVLTVKNSVITCDCNDIFQDFGVNLQRRKHDVTQSVTQTFFRRDIVNLVFSPRKKTAFFLLFTPTKRFVVTAIQLPL